MFKKALFLGLLLSALAVVPFTSAQVTAATTPTASEDNLAWFGGRGYGWGGYGGYRGYGWGGYGGYGGYRSYNYYPSYGYGYGYGNYGNYGCNYCY